MLVIIVTILKHLNEGRLNVHPGPPVKDVATHCISARGYIQGMAGDPFVPGHYLRDFIGTCRSRTMHYIGNPVDREKIWSTSVVRTLILYKPVFWPRLDSILLGDDANFMDIDTFRQALHCLRGWAMPSTFIYQSIELYGSYKGFSVMKESALWRKSCC